jgi:hypothetical protein
MFMSKLILREGLERELTDRKVCPIHYTELSRGQFHLLSGLDHVFNTRRYKITGFQEVLLQ